MPYFQNHNTKSSAYFNSQFPYLHIIPVQLIISEVTFYCCSDLKRKKILVYNAPINVFPQRGRGGITQGN